MGIDFKEVAATRIDMRKCGDNHDKIFEGEKVEYYKNQELEKEPKFDFWMRQTLRDKPSQMLSDWCGERRQLQSQLKETQHLLKRCLKIIKKEINVLEKEELPIIKEIEKSLEGK